MTRQVVVNFTTVFDDPQDATVDGVAVRLTFEELLLAVRVRPVKVGRHVNESDLAPWPVVASNSMVSDFADQVALGDAAETNPTAA